MKKDEVNAAMMVALFSALIVAFLALMHYCETFRFWVLLLSGFALVVFCIANFDGKCRGRPF
jgi:hypothetical protein